MTGMNDRLIEELLYTCASNEILSENFIEDLINRIVVKEKLNGYIGKAKLLYRDNKESCFGKAHLNRETNDKTITINMYKYQQLLERGIMPYDVNSRIITTIYHELEHIRQMKKIEDKNGDFEAIISDFEALILVLCSWKSKYIAAYDAYFDNTSLLKILKDVIVTGGKLNKKIAKIADSNYKKLYKLDPYERLAKAKSEQAYINDLKSSKTYSEKLANLIVYHQNIYEDKLKEGYYVRENGKLSIPIYDYFKGNDQLECLNGITIYSSNPKEFLENSKACFTRDERMMYGLPIAPNEYSAPVRTRR